ncbi:MAG: FAD-dependent oxidoreductase [bacterium]
MIRTTDVLVVGGGIAGLCTALAVAEQKLRVLIVDEPRPGAASRAAAGMLAPSLEGLPPAVHAIALEARDYYPEFLAELKEQTGVAVALNRTGILELAVSDADLDVLVARAGETAQRLDAQELAMFEPAFAGHPGAVLHPLDGAVDNVALMHALELAAERAPRVGRLAGRVDALDFAGTRPRARIASGDQVECASVLLATGAWGTALPGLPRALPVRPVRGELLTLDALPIRHVTYGVGGYLVPRTNSLLIGATSEESGFENRATPVGRASLLSIAKRAIPSLGSAPVADHWAGLRPVTPDALPILGRDPNTRALVYAVGFSRNGILLAPWAARELARQISGTSSQESLASFSPARLGSPLSS